MELIELCVHLLFIQAKKIRGLIKYKIAPNQYRKWNNVGAEEQVIKSKENSDEDASIYDAFWFPTKSFEIVRNVVGRHIMYILRE